MDQEPKAKKQRVNGKSKSEQEVAIVNSSNDKDAFLTSKKENTRENTDPVFPAAAPRKRKPKIRKEESDRLLALEEERWREVLKVKFIWHMDEYQKWKHPCDVLYEYEGDMLDEYVLMYGEAQTGHLNILAKVINEHRERHGRVKRVNNPQLTNKMGDFRRFLKEKETKPDTVRICRQRIKGTRRSTEESWQRISAILKGISDQVNVELNQKDLDAKKPKSAGNRSTRKASEPSTSAQVDDESMEEVSQNYKKDQVDIPSTVLKGASSSCHLEDEAVMEEPVEKIEDLIGIVVDDFSIDIENEILHAEADEIVHGSIEIDKEEAELIPNNETGNDLILQSIFHNGKPLRVSGNIPHVQDVVIEILQNIRATIEHSVLDSPDRWVVPPQPDNATIVEYMKVYTTIAKQFATNWSGSYNTNILGQWGEPNCTATVVIAIANYTYRCAVPRPLELNTYYESFTSETYGETNVEQMKIIIDQMKLGPEDVFVDLGHGVGQLVCFTAAYAECKKSVGIELSDVPAKMGTDFGKYFKKLTDFFGKNCGKYELFHGDFLNPRFRKLICEEATVIFLNNFAFSPKLMLEIKETLLMELKNGVRIITTKPFGNIKKETTSRSVNDLTAISHTHKLKSLSTGGVSWTGNKVQYYCTTIDHTKLIKYYVAESQRKKLRDYKSALKKSKTANRMSAEKVDA